MFGVDAGLLQAGWPFYYETNHVKALKVKQHNNKNPFNGPLSTTIGMSLYQKKYSLTCCLSLWELFNVFN